jgi:hypothetical protein
MPHDSHEIGMPGGTRTQVNFLILKDLSLVSGQKRFSIAASHVLQLITGDEGCFRLEYGNENLLTTQEHGRARPSMSSGNDQFVGGGLPRGE